MNTQKKTFGFIIPVHCSTSDHLQYYKICYNGIRKYYDNKIIFINDNSALFKTDFEEHKHTFTNVGYIDSNFPGRGELLPYFYFFVSKFFDIAVIIHDSMFIQHPFPIDIEKVENVQFLWCFNEYEPYYKGFIDFATRLMNVDPSLYDKRRLFNDQENCWIPCFGVSSIITHEFITLLHRSFNFFGILLPCIDTRFYRMCLERLFGVLCYALLKDNIKKTIFGNIETYGSFTYSGYLKNKEKLKHFPILKILSDR